MILYFILTLFIFGSSKKGFEDLFLRAISMKHLICPVFDLKEQFFTLNNFNICMSILKITLVRLGECSLNLTELILGASGFLFPQVETAEELPNWFLGVDTNRLV